MIPTLVLPGADHISDIVNKLLVTTTTTSSCQSIIASELLPLDSGRRLR
jgi:hypothetical protein